MPKFQIEMIRTRYEIGTVTIEAENRDEAQERAWEIAHNHNVQKIDQDEITETSWSLIDQRGEINVDGVALPVETDEEMTKLLPHGFV